MVKKMSTFDGIIKEIKGLSVDRFDGENLTSTVYFLSHCHTDHMKGLNTFSFQEKIARDNNYIYLSNISAIILRRLIPQLSNHIKELPLEQATSILLGDKYISVTCVPAGHCPGSVMFLFETEEVCVLYTGDYRISTTDITKFRCFYDNFGKVKTVHNIYLDTTFFTESYRALPKRNDSISELCKVILNWISEDTENCVKLDLPAKYGYEYVFKEIYNFCKMPVHVDTDKFNFYSMIPELDQCVTTEGLMTKIHNCQHLQRDICASCNPDKLRVIKLSAFRWRNEDLQSKGITEIDDNGIFYVCYSTHASYEEGLALIDFLQPKDIHICVERPYDPIITLEIKKLVRKHLKRIHGENIIESIKLFNVDNVSVKSDNDTRNPDIIADSPSRFDDKTNILDSYIDSTSDQ